MKAIGEHPLLLDTLAAAHAENGDFAAALDVTRRALKLGNQQRFREPELKMLRDHLAQLEAGRPIRE